MIFAVEGHIEMIRNGLMRYHLLSDILNCPAEQRIVKTETRRPKRGIYQVGKDYAVQRKRGVKAESDIRIMMDEIWLETQGIVRTNYFLECMGVQLNEGILYVRGIPISKENAWAEGGYTPEGFEKIFSEVSPKWDGWKRWAFKFHVVEV